MEAGPLDEPPTAGGEIVDEAGPRPTPLVDPAREGIVRQFVEHWGMMARSWGINASMGEMFALLYLTGNDWTADELREWLLVSRGNVSMNLRELMGWGVVHKVHRQGERREFFRAEADVWTLFRRILGERKRRELDPTLRLLEETVGQVEGDPALGRLEDRLTALREFFALIDTLATRLVALKPEEAELIRLFFRAGGDANPIEPANA